jgi:hypothetical protein
MALADNLGFLRGSTGAYKKTTRLIVLAALADFLLFDAGLGANLFLFAAAISGVILLPVIPIWPRGKTIGMIIFLLIAFTPLLDAPSLIAILIATSAGMFLALAAHRLTPRRGSGVLVVLLRFLAIIPFRLAESTIKFSSGLRAPDRPQGFWARLWASLRSWVVPLLFASVFLLLFAMANPLIEAILRSFDPIALLRRLDFWRISFWIIACIFIWPMLSPRLMHRTRHRFVVAQEPVQHTSAFLDASMLLRCLVVFNALFAVQTLMDMAYLWGGIALPDGMSHAEYAHRGAYPLMVTALLAAGFVLVAMRRNGPGEESPLIRHLVFLWIGQNFLLCLSSIMRLDFYVEVYSLTELRVAAGVWMGLIAIGLTLIFLRILLGRSNEWLISANLTALAIVLYGYALIDVDGFIARFNVEHSLELSGQGMALDVGYISTLGPSAIPALDSYISKLPPRDKAEIAAARSYRDTLEQEFQELPGDWRSWNFRDWRLTSYLAVQTPLPAGVGAIKVELPNSQENP